MKRCSLSMPAYVAVAATLMLAGCGGGNSSPNIFVPGQTGTQNASDLTRTYTLDGGAVSLAVPPVGGFTGVLALPATTVAAGTKLTLTSSLQAPGGTAVLQDLKRNVQTSAAAQATGELDVYFYTTIVASATITFPSLPGFSVTLPATIDPSGRQFSYAIQEKSSNGAVLSFRTEGPATVSGRTVTFASATTPLTLRAGESYLIAFYSTTVASTSSEHMYVLSRGANPASTAVQKVTVYPANANGNVAPLRTISGSNTRLNFPVAIAVDAGGYLYVLNSGNESITVYGPQASGNVAPVRTIAGSLTRLSAAVASQINTMALDGRGNLAVINSQYPTGGGLSEIDVYDTAANGNVAPKRTIVPAPSERDFQLLAGNGTGQLAVYQESEYPDGYVNVYGFDASGGRFVVRSFPEGYINLLAFAGDGTIADAFDHDSFIGITIYPPGASGVDPPSKDLTQGRCCYHFDLFAQMAFDAEHDLAVPLQADSSGTFPANQIYIFGPQSTDILKPLRTLGGSATGIDDAYAVTFGP